MGVQNFGRTVQFVNGINGFVSGGSAVLNMDVNKRYHRNLLQTTAVNYTGGTSLAITKITGAGTGATGTPTIVNGAVTAIVITAGGSGWNVGDTFTIVDATGTGFIGTAATVTGGPPGALATATVTNGGTASPCNPVTVISSLQQIVNGVVIRDCSVDSILRIINSNGFFPALGELPLYYTDPSDNINQLNELTSWDMFGQSTFTIKPTVSKTVGSPGLNAIMEFDGNRNVRPTAKGLVPFLQPVAVHEYSFNLIAGLNKINTIPFDYPIRRMWFLGGTPGNLTQIEVNQDGNKVMEATYAQMRQDYEDYGFQFGRNNYLVDTYATSASIKGNYNPINFFDFAYISDPDRRIAKALTCENSLVIRLSSAVQQAVTVVVETLPGQYAS